MDEREQEVGELVHALEEFFLDGGEVFLFGFAVLVAVLGAGLAPTAAPMSSKELITRW